MWSVLVNLIMMSTIRFVSLTARDTIMNVNERDININARLNTCPLSRNGRTIKYTNRGIHKFMSPLVIKFIHVETTVQWFRYWQVQRDILAKRWRTIGSIA